MNQYTRKRIFFLLLSAGVVVSQQMDMPLTPEEDVILMQELAWAEKAMEGYKRKTGTIPLRSSIQAPHVHTEEWRRESINVFSQSASKDNVEDVVTTSSQLRRRAALGSDI